MNSPPFSLPWLSADTQFPDVELAWGAGDPAPGLLAAGGSLDVASLTRAYSQGIFPWYSSDQPILWWSPDPRMVLRAQEFRLHRSLRKTIGSLLAQGRCEIRVDSAFDAVIRACSTSPRQDQAGTWIVADMIEAYGALHRAGYAHCVECWIDGQLAGGLYFVSIGRAVFGESMFTRLRDASKIALAALVCLCRLHEVRLIDCQQNTRHLASLGAREIPRREFVAHVRQAIELPPPLWEFKPLYWNQLLDQAA